jgi:hypothetical protein
VTYSLQTSYYLQGPVEVGTALVVAEELKVQEVLVEVWEDSS